LNNYRDIFLPEEAPRMPMSMFCGNPHQDLERGSTRMLRIFTDQKWNRTAITSSILWLWNEVLCLPQKKALINLWSRLESCSLSQLTFSVKNWSA